MNYGLIFNENDIIYLGKYNNELKITEFVEISDFDGIYDELLECHFVFVKIDDQINDSFFIKDIEWIIMEYQGENITIRDFLIKNKFPSDDSNEIFIHLYNNFVNKKDMN